MIESAAGLGVSLNDVTLDYHPNAFALLTNRSKITASEQRGQGLGLRFCDGHEAAEFGARRGAAHGFRMAARGLLHPRAAAQHRCSALHALFIGSG